MEINYLVLVPVFIVCVLSRLSDTQKQQKPNEKEVIDSEIKPVNIIQQIISSFNSKDHIVNAPYSDMVNANVEF
ncbi:hypothetical protein N824_15170 [Pedobacter sp. V48]|nr:hypothetical protein N824_15170 [Pedobacter sp. V48]